MLLAHDWFGDSSVFVVDLPLACCALETQAALQGKAARAVTEVPAQAKVVVTLSGTVTGPLGNAVEQALGQLNRPVTVVSFGACACAGGPYWDSYAVKPGAGSLVQIDHFIAGCPPPPSALGDFLAGIERRNADVS